MRETKNSYLFIRRIISLFITILILQNISYALSNIESDSLIDKKVEELLLKMTTEEKIGQMTNIGLTAICEGEFWNDADSLIIDTSELRYMIDKYHIGSVQGKGKYPPSKEEWHRIIKQIQDFAINETRLGIPVLYGIDGIHGANYTASSVLFPQQIACAATWNTEFAEKMGKVTSYELKASSIPWNFSPVLDISGQPLWGRIFETFGEDTYIAAEMGEAFTRGAQSNDISNDFSTAVCLKHFIGYGNPNNGKDRSTAKMTEYELRQYYLPPFEKSIEAGALTIMLNSGSINGIPGHIDSHLINDILKGELGFEGFVISDWDDMTKLVNAYKVAKDTKEATKLSVMAGMDMCMVPYNESFAVSLMELVEEGEVPIERINDATRRILKVKFKLGLFEKPYTNPDDYPLFGSDKFIEYSYNAAKESITLLKNESNILPLGKNTKVLVTGPTANSINHLNGAWSRTWSGIQTEYNDNDKLSVLQAIENKLGSNNVFYSPGSGIDENINDDKVYKLAKKSDIIIACLGENPATEKPSDIDQLELPEAQQQLIKNLAKSGKPIIIVLLQSRPRIIREIEKLSKGIIMAYLPGHEGGKAIADIIMGDINPSGHLPYTYPRYSGSIWNYNHKASEAVDRNFELNAFIPQYEFGEGLSYTDFEYSNLVLSTDTLINNDTLKITIEVKNIGDRYGKTVAQLYTKDVVASISPDVKNLKRFTKTALNAGESKTLTFYLNKNDLAFVNTNNEWVTEEGEFQLLVGGSPSELQKISFYYKNYQ